MYAIDKQGAAASNRGADLFKQPAGKLGRAHGRRRGRLRQTRREPVRARPPICRHRSTISTWCWSRCAMTCTASRTRRAPPIVINDVSRSAPRRPFPRTCRFKLPVLPGDSRTRQCRGDHWCWLNHADEARFLEQRPQAGRGAGQSTVRACRRCTACWPDNAEVQPADGERPDRGGRGQTRTPAATPNACTTSRWKSDKLCTCSHARALDDLFWGSLLHDVAKIGIPDAVLCKPGRLTRDEFTFIMVHPERSYEILRQYRPPKGRRAGRPPPPRKKYDGTGYPHGSEGHRYPATTRASSRWPIPTTRSPARAPTAPDAATESGDGGDSCV